MKEKLEEGLERMFNKYQVFSVIKQEIKDKTGVEDSLKAKALACLMNHKRASIEVLVGELRNDFKSAQEASDFLYQLIMEDLVDYDLGTKEFITKIVPDEDTQRKIDTYQFPLPSVSRPLRLRKNNDTGYRTWKSCLILKRKQEEEDICLDHLNRLNGISYKVDKDQLWLMRNVWKDIDSKRADESIDEYHQRKKQYDKYCDNQKWIATLLGNQDRFWFCHAYDKRGRTYCRGFHCSTQNNDYGKSFINFAQGEYINANSCNQ